LGNKQGNFQLHKFILKENIAQFQGVGLL